MTTLLNLDEFKMNLSGIKTSSFSINCVNILRQEMLVVYVTALFCGL
jgi:hypothetical protein